MLESTPAAAVEQRDLYDRWPEFFRSWADGSTILIGDAIHPMMPNLGQVAALLAFTWTCPHAWDLMLSERVSSALMSSTVVFSLACRADARRLRTRMS